MNSFGDTFRITVFGESHGPCVGVTVEGCKVGMSLSIDDFIEDLSRRKSGSIGTTQRIEDDMPIILSGVYNNNTTGGPLTIVFKNKDTRSSDYESFRHHPRPSHADFVSRVKYKGYSDIRGGGQFSGRMTLPLVAAGVIAKKMLDNDITISSEIIEIGGEKEWQSALNQAIQEKDSLGGIVQCTILGLPIGYGSPFFNSLESIIAHLAFSIPAIKGIEFGDGFQVTKTKGSLNNDCIIDQYGATSSNHSGGINGGISNGNPIVFRVAVKPTSSIGISQMTYDFQTNQIEPLTISGRHDACIALRVPPILEAITAIALLNVIP